MHKLYEYYAFDYVTSTLIPTKENKIYDIGTA
jgi:hypothetical protein